MSESNLARMNGHYMKAQNEINETFQYFSTILEEGGRTDGRKHVRK